jgi:predicted PurR-regulated permease PerM
MEEAGIEKSSPGENANGALKALGVVLTIVAFITGVASIVRPLQQQIAYLQNQINLVEVRIEKKVDKWTSSHEKEEAYQRNKADEHIKEDIKINTKNEEKTGYLEKELDRLRDTSDKAR